MRIWLSAGVMAILILVATRCGAQPLTPAQTALLPHLSAEAAQSIVPWCVEAAAIVREAEELRAAWQTAGDNLDTRKQLAQRTASLLRRCGAGRDVLTRLGPAGQGYVQRLEEGSNRVKEAARACLRASEAAEAEILALQQQLQELTSALRAMDELRQPAAFVQRFVDEQITAWMQQPHEVGGIRFRIEKTDPTRSLFTPEADLRIVLQYQDNLQLQARGLYFQYSPGKIPEPKLERLEVERSSLDSLANVALKSLGSGESVIPASWGLPIKIKNPQWHNFQTPGQAGCLTLDIEIGGFLDFASGLALQTQVTITPRGEVKLGKDGLTFRDATTRIPLGTTGLIFDGYTVQLRPGNKEQAVSLTTFIAPASGKQSGVYLSITASFGFPLKAIHFEGHLMCLEQQLGKVQGELAADHISGKLEIPGDTSLPLKDVLSAQFQFHLDKSGLTADGMVSLFRAVERSMDLAVRFDGSGHLQARESFRIAGVTAEGSLTVQLEPGFQKLTLDALLCVEVPLKLYTADATVRIHAESGRPIEVQAAAMDVEVSFEVDMLDALTVERIATELLKELDDLLQNVAEAAADWEKDKKELLGRWNDHWCETLSNEARKYGVDALRTGNEDFDRVLGDIAREGKGAGKLAADLYKRSGGEAAKFLQDPGKAILGAPDAILRDIKIGGGRVEIGPIRIGGGGDDEPEGPSEQEVRAVQLRAQVEERLQPLVGALSGHQFEQLGTPESQLSGDRLRSRRAELHGRFSDATAVALERGDALVGLIISVSSFRCDVASGVGSRNERQQATAVRGAVIHLTSLLPRDPRDVPPGESPGRPKARIEVPELADASGYDARRLAYVELQHLIERFLPEVEIEGPREFTENDLEIVNTTDETIRIAVQVRQRVVQETQFRDLWVPGPPGSATVWSATLKPGEKWPPPAGNAGDVAGGLAGGNPAGGWRPDGASVGKEGAGLGPVRGAVARIWAESESGEVWREFQSQDLALVPPNPALGGRRAYMAEQRGQYRHEIKHQPGARMFSERLVALRNETRETLRGRLGWYRRSNGSSQWQWTPVWEIAPGQLFEPRDATGLRIRASEIVFVAEGEHLRFDQHRTQPISLVEPIADGRRVYRAEKIDRHLQLLQPAHARPAN